MVTAGTEIFEANGRRPIFREDGERERIPFGKDPDRE